MAKDLLTKLKARPEDRRLEWHELVSPSLLAQINEAIDLWHSGDREWRARFKKRTPLGKAIIEDAELDISVHTIIRYIDGRKPNGKKSR